MLRISKIQFKISTKMTVLMPIFDFVKMMKKNLINTNFQMEKFI